VSAIYRDRWRIENFFKALKQKPEGQNLRGTSENALLHSNLDSIDCHVADQVPSVQIQIWMVTVESGGFPALEPLYLQGSMGMDRPSLRCIAVYNQCLSTRAIFGLVLDSTF